MPLFLTLRGATNALPITSAWVGLKPATTNPTWTTANHSQIVSRLHRVAYPGGSILTSRGGLILDSAEELFGHAQHAHAHAVFGDGVGHVLFEPASIEVQRRRDVENVRIFGST
jgi:hypothetical protein